MMMIRRVALTEVGKLPLHQRKNERERERERRLERKTDRIKDEAGMCKTEFNTALQRLFSRSRITLVFQHHHKAFKSINTKLLDAVNYNTKINEGV